MSHDPICICRAKSVEEAEIIVAWLGENDVEATIVDPSNPGVMAFGVTDPEGIAIYVGDTETATRAQTLLVEHDKRHAEASAALASVDGIDIVCAECGETITYPPDMGGTVQECPECGANLDVPPIRSG